jgi:hypothetical protein
MKQFDETHFTMRKVWSSQMKVVDANAITDTLLSQIRTFGASWDCTVLISTEVFTGLGRLLQSDLIESEIRLADLLHYLTWGLGW